MRSEDSFDSELFAGTYLYENEPAEWSRYPLLTESELVNPSIDPEELQYRREEEELVQHIRTCTVDGFCEICQCM